MHDNNLFKKAPVSIKDYSGFDCSFEHMLTTDVGVLTPVLTKTLIPGDKIEIDLSKVEVSLPPLATDAYGKVDAKLEAFWVPNRIIDKGWKKLVEKTSVGNVPTSAQLDIILDGYAAGSEGATCNIFKIFRRGTLSDYLGLKTNIYKPQEDNGFILYDGEDYNADINDVYMDNHWIWDIHNLHPWFAYHKIYCDWYLNPLIQKNYMDEDELTQAAIPSSMNMAAYDCNNKKILLSNTTNTAITSGYTTTINYEPAFSDGSGLFTLKKRNYSKGYFTSCTPQPQFGNASSVKFDVSAGTGSFTIATLRAANALQHFVERNNIGAGRYSDIILGQFGTLPSDSLTNRAVYLGSYSTPIYSRSVFQTNSNYASTVNPLQGSVGSTGGAANAYGSGNLCKYEVSEHGTLMVLFSIVPRAIYSTGTDRELKYGSYADYPNPMLASIGNQAVRVSELEACGFMSNDYNNKTFGYQDRYSEAKYVEDKVSGLFADGMSLDSFVLKRSFLNQGAVLGSDFVSIPKTALDDIAAVSSSISMYGAQVDLAFNFKKVSRLPQYSIPSLSDYEHDSHTIMVDKGARML